MKTALLAVFATATVAYPGMAEVPPADAWEIGPQIRGRNYSIGMPEHPIATGREGVAFDFPQRGEVDALTTAITPIAGARAIVLRYRIDARPGTRFVSAETPEQAATISLYLQRNGDNWSAKGKYASYRWYVPARAVLPLSVGTHKVEVRLDETWTNVRGWPNTQDREGFAAALQDTSRLGIAFGTASARSHGVYTTGPARFTLLDLEIK